MIAGPDTLEVRINESRGWNAAVFVCLNRRTPFLTLAPGCSKVKAGHALATHSTELIHVKSHTRLPLPAVAHVSHTGHVRKNNEDSIAIVEEQGIFVLADGMGGHEGGEIASRVAVDSVVQSISSGQALVDAIVEANKAVVSAGQRVNAPTMGTTVVALQLKGRDFEVAWVGDSRAYRFNGGPERLTSDQSVVGDMVASGQIGEAEARVHPMRGLLTQALGTAGLNPSSVGAVTGRLGPGEYLLLCSDGLHGLLEDEEMLELIRSAGSVQSGADALLQAALERGGTDNVSLVLIMRP